MWRVCLKKYALRLPQISPDHPHLYQPVLVETHYGDSQTGKSLNQCGEQKRRFAMGAAIALRGDFDGSGLRRLAKVTKDAGQSRRLLILAAIYDGGARSDAARIGGVGLQVIRDWVLRFNAEGPNGLIDRKAPGQPPKLNDDQREALARLVEDGPIPAIHGVVRWRLRDLAHWLWEEFRISLDETTVGRELKALGFRKISARPRHYAQNELAIDDFKKTFPPSWKRSATRSRSIPT
jgi:transposase